MVAAVSAPHRAEAFAAARFAIDALKVSVPVWKREVWGDGSEWGTNAQQLIDRGRACARHSVARSVDVAFVVVLLIAAAVAAVVVIVMLRNRSAHSSVDSFRRHIDALGPEARRNVVDQVQSAPHGRRPATKKPTTTNRRRRATRRRSADEDGARGT